MLQADGSRTIRAVRFGRKPTRPQSTAESDTLPKNIYTIGVQRLREHYADMEKMSKTARFLLFNARKVTAVQRMRDKT